MSASIYLNTLLQDWKNLLVAWARGGELTEAAKTALGLEGEPEGLKRLVGQWKDRDFSELPPIVLLPAEAMPGAAGAYAISTATIYLNQDWLQIASRNWAFAVLTEELGHHLDGLLNAVDTPGDEGEIFSSLAQQNEKAIDNPRGGRSSKDDTIVKHKESWLAAEAAAIPWTAMAASMAASGYYDSYRTSDGRARIAEIASFPDGSFTLASSFYPTAEIGSVKLSSDRQKVFLARLNKEGAINWIQDLGEAQKNYFVRSIDPLPDGAILATGWLTYTALAGDFARTFTTKHGPNGTLEWKTEATSANTNQIGGSIFSRDIAALPDGSSVIIGDFTGKAFFGDITATAPVGSGAVFIAKINPNGTYSWARILGSSFRNTAGRGITALQDGSVLITGNFNSAIQFGERYLQPSGSESDDIFIAKIDANGFFSWAQKAGGAWTDRVSDITALPDGSSIITGTFFASASFGDIRLEGPPDTDSVFVAKLGTDGKFAWAISPKVSAITNTVTLDNGGVLIAGHFTDTAWLGQTRLSSASHEPDIFIAQISQAGTIEWGLSGGGTGADYVSDLCASSNGSAIITGTFQEPITLGGVTLQGSSQATTDNIFIFKINTDRDGTESNPVVTLTLSPNSAVEDGSANLIYTFTRTGSSSNPLTVNYTIGGSSTPGTDYAAIATSVSFAAGASTATVTLDPIADTEAEPDEVIELTLAQGEGYVIGSVGAVTGTIVNDDQSPGIKQPSDGPYLSISSFNENITADTTVGILTGGDSDTGGMFTYELVDGIGDADNSYFSTINDRLIINISPDYETKPLYSIRVRAKGSGGLALEKSFVLFVNDLEENVDSPRKKGTSGNDSFTGGREPISDTYYGYEGNDRIEGGGGNDNLYGGNDNDFIGGDEGNDKLYGENGEDTLTGGSGDDLIDGGQGRDILDYGNGRLSGFLISTYGSQSILVDLRPGSALQESNRGNGLFALGQDLMPGMPFNAPATPGIPGGNPSGPNIVESGFAKGSEIGRDTILGVEDIITADGDDIIYGNQAGNAIDGGGGDDQIYGNDGDDILVGAQGDDEIDGGPDNDQAIYSGKQRDYAIGYDPTTSKVTIKDQREFHDGIDTITGVESFKFADTVLTLSALIEGAVTSTPSAMDLTGDGIVNFKDALLLMRGLIGTYPGDSLSQGIPEITDVGGLRRNITKAMEKTDAAATIAYLDIDGDGIIHPLGDALMIAQRIHHQESSNATFQMPDIFENSTRTAAEMQIHLKNLLNL